MDVFTEQDWMTSSDAHAMLEFLYPITGLHSTPVQPRKLRLYYAALVRRDGASLPGSAITLLKLAEELADGLSLSQAEIAELLNVAEMLVESGGPNCAEKWSECERRLARLRRMVQQKPSQPVNPWANRDVSHEKAWPLVLALQTAVPSAKLLRRAYHDADLLREIYGNPFSAVALANWRTVDVVGIANKCYEESDFRALPILADALQEAGCPDSHPLVQHCRDEPLNTHARGCWALDAILQK